ncbi:MAG TPA: hypothetical protein VFE32_20035 [Puia sp.]|nr:hypothetical protein [Puia sp.]
MRSTKIFVSMLLAVSVLSAPAFAQQPPPSGPPAQAEQQQDWPRSFTMDDGTVVKIYQPQPESFSNNVLKSRWAISVLQLGKTDPVFGTFWSVANVETDRDARRVVIQSAKVPNVKFPGQPDENFTNSMKTALETNLPATAGDLSLDELLASLDQDLEQQKMSKNLNTNAPRIIYQDHPSLLVVIDGQPKLQTNKDWGLDVVVNTPFTIVKGHDNQFYLYGAKHWYTAQQATGPYSPAGNVPSELQQVQSAVDNANSSQPGYTDSAAVAQDNVVSDIVVSTSPAELIQTNGQPTFTPIQGTGLSYASNSSNDIFQDQGGKYYVLISGRWYTSGSLTGGWHYLAANALPADFARIPEGSPKDNVLASVAGTDAAREAIMDAQIPQTAKVDRNSATTSVNYDGDPQFAPVQGTDMQYAINTGSSVIQENGVYYSVDNGVWFQAPSPNGPWTVATERPADVDAIPPTSPLYNVKYVYVYDVTPDYVYMGYTPGYLNDFVYGPTCVYGTGFYYNPWFNGFYYPRPWSWGFGFGYNPYVGWSLGFGYGFGWFHGGWGAGWHGGWGGWRGGWWGPASYHPAYAWNRYRSVGFYGAGFARNRNVFANSYHTNIYASRRGVVTRDNHSFAPRPGGVGGVGGRPGGFANGARPGTNNVFSDRAGNVYQRTPTNQWQQRSNNSWRPMQNNPQVRQNLNRQQQMRDRGQVRTQNFNQARGFSRPSGGVSRPSGGGARPSGGGSRPSGGGGSRGGRH